MDSKNIIRDLLYIWMCFRPRSPIVGDRDSWLHAHFGMLLFVKSILGKRFVDVGIFPYVVSSLRSTGTVSCIVRKVTTVHETPSQMRVLEALLVVDVINTHCYFPNEDSKIRQVVCCSGTYRASFDVPHTLLQLVRGR